MWNIQPLKQTTEMWKQSIWAVSEACQSPCPFISSTHHNITEICKLKNTCRPLFILKIIPLLNVYDSDRWEKRANLPRYYTVSFWFETLTSSNTLLGHTSKRSLKHIVQRWNCTNTQLKTPSARVTSASREEKASNAFSNLASFRVVRPQIYSAPTGS